MNAFVEPKPESAEVEPEFNQWFKEQLRLHWKYDFGKGVLVLKLPPHL